MSSTRAYAAAAALLLSFPLTPALADTKVFKLPDMILSTPEAFCGDGSIAGTATTPDWVTVAFTYTNKDGKLKQFSVPGSTYTSAHACYKGRLMGQTIVNEVHQGFAVLPDGSVQLVSPADSNWASVNGTNSSGTLVGYYYPNDLGGKNSAGFLLKKDGSFSQYVIPNYSQVQLVHITEDGTLLGNRSLGNPLRTYGFIDRQGVIEEVKVPSSYSTFVTGMNADGQIVGYYYQSGSAKRGFAMKNGVYKAFALPSNGGDTYPMAIDNDSRVVGYLVNTVDWSSVNFIAKLGQLIER